MAAGRRRRRWRPALLWALAAVACRTPPPPPAPAPAWQGRGADGEPLALVAGGDGAPLVLEWWSASCPYVGQHYREGKIQAMQAAWRAAGRRWWWVVSLPSGAPPPAAGGLADAQRAAAAAVDHVVIDLGGRLAGALGVAVTPTVVVIDAAGRLGYHGAIDGRSRAYTTGVAAAPPPPALLAEALAAVAAGRQAATTTSRPLGCALRLPSVAPAGPG